MLNSSLVAGLYHNKKFAFTLAEVLITLGIIGVVSAMTLPTLTQHYAKKAVEGKLAKFYTKYNQAIQMAETVHGSREYWYDDSNSVLLDEDGNPIEGSSSVDAWFQVYLSNFITLRKKVYSNGKVLYTLADGSSFQYGSNDVATSRGLFFIPGDPEKCDVTVRENIGICAFYFLYDPLGLYSSHHRGKGLEPSMYSWNGSRSQLLNACKYSDRGKCTTLIRYDGWKISDDYPWKVRE